MCSFLAVTGGRISLGTLVHIVRARHRNILDNRYIRARFACSPKRNNDCVSPTKKQLPHRSPVTIFPQCCVAPLQGAAPNNRAPLDREH